MTRAWFNWILVAAGLLATSSLAAQSQSQADWPAVAGDVGATKFSPADQITPANVGKLTQAWTYQTGGAAPIVVGNLMYFVSAGNVVALNADAGTEAWRFPLADAAPGGAIRRGMTYWPGTPPHAPRVLVTMSAGKLVQLDARTGKLVAEAGVVDLDNGIMSRIPGGEAYTIASPVAVYKNVAIFPGRTGEHNRWGIPGDLRGFDLLTGKELWRFHTVPHPGDPNFGTWGLNGWQDRKGPGSWQPLTVDNANGLVFVALGNAVDQNYGNSRPGSNLYSASVVALEAATGKYKWHFQTAHHDIYDGDLNAPPMLAEVNRGGQRIPAIVQMTKTGLLFQNGKDGWARAYDVDTGKVLWKGKTAGQSIGIPAMYQWNGRQYVVFMSPSAGPGDVGGAEGGGTGGAPVDSTAPHGYIVFALPASK